MRRAALTMLVAPLVFALSACGPGDPEPTPTPSAAKPSPSASATPSAKPEAVPLAEDVLMVVTTTATADNGAVMDVALTVHRATAWNDPAGADRPPVMTAACAGYLDDSVYEGLLWSFATVDVSAVQRPGAAWPAGHRLVLAPSGAFVSLAASGFPADDDQVDGSVPHCARDRVVDRPGAGVIVAGFPGDTADVGAAGQFTIWANHGWGVTASAGTTLSDCEHVVTDAGAALHGDADWWGSSADGAHCVFGTLAEQP